MDESDNEMDFDEDSLKQPFLAKKKFKNDKEWRSIDYYPFTQTVFVGRRKIVFNKGTFKIIGRCVEHKNFVLFFLEKEERIIPKRLLTLKNLLFLFLLLIPVINVIAAILFFIIHVRKIITKIPIKFAFMIHERKNPKFFKGLFFTSNPSKKFSIVKQIIEKDQEFIFDYTEVIKILKLNPNLALINWQTAGCDPKRLHDSLKKIPASSIHY